MWWVCNAGSMTSGKGPVTCLLKIPRYLGLKPAWSQTTRIFKTAKPKIAPTSQLEQTADGLSWQNYGVQPSESKANSDGDSCVSWRESWCFFQTPLHYPISSIWMLSLPLHSDVTWHKPLCHLFSVKEFCGFFHTGAYVEHSVLTPLVHSSPPCIPCVRFW